MDTCNIRLEDLHPTYQHIAKIIGIENTLKLGREIGGEGIYFPRLDSHLSPFIKERNRLIVEEFKTSSVTKLAKKYKLTTRQIYTIINRHKQGTV